MQCGRGRGGVEPESEKEEEEAKRRRRKEDGGRLALHSDETVSSSPLSSFRFSNSCGRGGGSRLGQKKAKLVFPFGRRWWKSRLGGI